MAPEGGRRVEAFQGPGREPPWRDAAERRDETLYRLLAEHSPLALWQADAGGRTTYANPAMRALLELEDAADLLAVGCDAFLAREDCERIRRGPLSTFEATIHGRRGSRRTTVACGGPLRGPDGRLHGLIATFLDVTEGRRLQEEQVRLEAKMREAQKLESLGVLAGGIAHDFNNILTAVLGNAGLALQRCGDEALRPILLRIEQAAERAAELTNQLLAYSGRGHFVVGPIDLGLLVESMRPLLNAAVPEDVALAITLGRRACVVAGDESQLRQLLLNLVSNAAEASAGRGGTVTVRVGVRDEGAGPGRPGDVVAGSPPSGPVAVLEVADEGQGMDARVLGRVFDPFFTTKRGGRGLGLAVVLGIIRGHRGGIRIRSAPERGASVEVLLPLARARPEEQPVDLQVPARRAGPATVLVVDDEEVVREVARLALEDAGYRTILAPDGESALRAFGERPEAFDLVLLDLTMPQMPGEEILRELRRLRPDVRVVICSGYSEGEMQDEVGTDRIAGFLQKPFRAQQLVSLVRGLLGD
jgi:PAS domain S-box-containing protein